MDAASIPLVSLIVPALNDREAEQQLLEQTPPDPRLEIVIVEGAPSTSDADNRQDLRRLHTGPGRARQMNAGAAVARGDWFIFLHADSRLPPNWLDIFERSVSPGALQVRGGWFRFALDDPAWQARLIERGVSLRVRLFHLPYGDQGLFAGRQVFAELGGYREMPLMEDVDFIRRLTKGGGVLEVPLVVSTSARRWRRDGWFRRSARNLTLLCLYFLGVSPERLAEWY